MNTEAAGTRISNISQALDNAMKHYNYFAPAGHGNKQLTTFGKAIVEALPNAEAVAAVQAERPKRKRKPSQTKKAA